MGDPNNKMSAAEIGLANIGRGGAEGLPADHIGVAGQVIRGALTGSQRDRVQREIAQTMSDLIADCRRGPNGFDPTNRERAPSVQVGGAVPARGAPGNGWRDPGPLGLRVALPRNAPLKISATAISPTGKPIRNASGEGTRSRRNDERVAKTRPRRGDTH
jgi:hypothetical protein